MTVEFARKFILTHPEARYKGDKRHATFLDALEAIEQHKREFISDKAQAQPGGAYRPPLDNPNWGRMQR